MHRGYVKVYRKMEDSGILQDQGACQFFLWAMFKATHKPRKQIVGNQVVDLQPGQFVSGRNSAAQELGISPSKFVRTMEKMKMLEFVDTKPNNKFTVFSIINWDTYQNERTASEQQTEQHTEQQADNKNGGYFEKSEKTHTKTGQQKVDDCEIESSGCDNVWTASEQQADSKRTASEQQADTNKNDKHKKNVRKKTLTETHPEYSEYATAFQNRVADLHGNLAPAITPGLINKAVDVIDKLIRIDGFTLPEIQVVMEWATGDDFWGQNAMSLAAVRKPLRNGTIKFKQIVADKQRRGIPRIGQQPDQFAGVI